MLSIKDLTIFYESKKAVDGISLEIAKGKFTGLIGPNGAGKSSLIKACVGLIEPDAGSIKFNDKPLKDHRSYIKQICGYAPENTVLMPYLKGREFLELIGTLRKTNDLNAEIDTFLDLLDLKNSADELINNYSHGMRKKIALAAAMMGNPEFLIFDEALNGLDSLTLYNLKKHLAHLAANQRTILITSHILPLMLEWCDPIVVMNEGKIVESFTAQQIKDVTRDVEFEEVFINLIKKT